MWLFSLMHFIIRFPPEVLGWPRHRLKVILKLKLTIFATVLGAKDSISTPLRLQCMYMQVLEKSLLICSEGKTLI